MIARLHDRIGTAGLVVAVVALVAALSGAAYAASGGLTPKEKKEVKRIAKSFQGVGPAGPQGAPGANGKDGANGTNGVDGAAGTNGVDGKSIIAGTEAPDPEGPCVEGGTWFEVEDSGIKRYACNGVAGEGGSGGGGVLAPGESQKGVWAVEDESSFFMLPITFPRPLASDVGFNLISEPTEGGAKTALAGDAGNCPGTTEDPEAEPGEFCMYAREFSGLSLSTANAYTYDRSAGFVVEFSITDLGYGAGTWAVTAPTP